MLKKGSILVLVAFVGLVPCAGSIRAQTDAEYLSAINFRFANPGARARGMGGAFVALADDASAAIVNPAGLAFLQQAQAAIELVSDEDEFPAPRLETGVVDAGGEFLQSHPPRRAIIKSDSKQISFASVVFPVKRRKLTMGIYYSSPLDTTTGGNTEALNVEIDSATFPSVSPFYAFYPTSSFVSAKNQVFGVAAGMRIDKRFAIGGSIGLSRLDFQGLVARFDFDRTDLKNFQTSTVDNEDAIFGSVGFLWQPVSQFSVGGSWQAQTRYDMSNESVGTTIRSFDSQFTIPTRWTLGVAFHPNNKWVFAVEADRIEYSDLFKESRETTFFGAEVGDPSYAYTFPDITEYHYGVEYTDRKTKFAFSARVGYWRDTSHSPYYAGEDELLQAWAPRLNEAIDHFTAGLGFDARRIILDLAVDHAVDAGTDILVSVVCRFGKLPG